LEPFPKEKIENIYRLIGKNVKKIREQKGLSQLDLAYSIGLKSVSMISFGEIYLHKKHFNIAHLAKIAKVLEVDICEFFEGVDEIIKEDN